MAESAAGPMALTATIYNFDIDLADNDRGVYETLALRVARHPSESEEYLLTRVIAYASEFAEGIEFSAGGLSSPDEPAMAIKDMTGALRAWIDVGTPDAERLHRASKAAPRVAVYVHRDPMQFLGRLAGERIHRAEALEIWAMDQALLRDLVARLERRMSLSLSITDRELFISTGAESLTGALRRCLLPG
ncbi:MAG: YaeQ family protein [Vicinamibacterales bacterium]